MAPQQNGHSQTNGNSSPPEPEESFLKQVADLILDQKLIGDEVQAQHPSLVSFKQPAQLQKLLNLKIERTPAERNDLLAFCRQVIEYSVKTNHPMFCNQLYGGIDEFSLAGSWLTDALNTSQATYEISPVFTLLEKQLMLHLGKLCGWKQEDIDGIFAPGGSMANIFGMITARHSKFPEIKKQGLAGHKLVTFVSEDAHYSFTKGSIWMGHGMESVIKVKSTKNGIMDVQNLETCIQAAIDNGQTPLMVVCTSGTTVLAAFDPIAEVHKVTSKFGIWLHVDACLGGTALFSRKHRTLMAGVELADSVAWNLHKLGGIPLQCSAFLTRHPKILIEANSLHAEYLFQSDKYYDASYDSGDKTVQCGRKVDSLKAWLALVARGDDKMEQLVDNVFEMAKYARDKISSTPNFKLVLDSFQGNTICFWYIPESMRTSGGHDLPPFERLNKVCPAIKAQMMETAAMMVNYQPLSQRNLPNFFRIVLSCIPPPNKATIDFFIDEISRIGSNIKL